MTDLTNDTIAAIITAPGIGAMGALRLSGPAAFAAAARVFRSKRGRLMEELGDYSLTYGGIYAGDCFLDQALLLKMKGPHSFTGEDVAELQCHGGPVVLGRLMETLTSWPDLPIKPAQPGEFSQRAFLNGKMDLSQAEAVMELVSASNQKAAGLAAEQIEGALSRRISQLKSRLLNLLASIEVDVDFPDEGLGDREGAKSWSRQLRQILADTAELLAAANLGKIYREGLRIVFYGRPNAGKSSLLNGILQEPRAIVTPEPGTTRDTLEERILLKGIPLVLTDTAGIRETGSQAEKAGVDRARQMALKADLVLYIVDMQEGITAEDRDLLTELDKARTLIVFNKMDLIEEDKTGTMTAEDMNEAGFEDWQCCRLSALDPHSLEILAKHIKSFFETGRHYRQSQEILLNRRQEEALLKSKTALEAALAVFEKGWPEDMAAIDLKQAWSALGELTGETVQPALVEEIFSRFCLGK
ncbi:MAG: tRNA uridine-5-carboxymethylaminomethyl(34) synthesis GTPase MnmE [Clostridiales bacterium]